MSIRSDTVVATIATSGSLSPSVDIEGLTVTGLLVPTATSAAITFQVSKDNSTFFDLFDNASTPAEVKIAAGTHNKAYQAPAALRGWRYMKVRSGISGTAVTQSSGLVVTLVGEAT